MPKTKPKKATYSSLSAAQKKAYSHLKTNYGDELAANYLVLVQESRDKKDAQSA